MPGIERRQEKMDKMTNRRGKGFTLVELLVVIIIIGILAGIMMLSAQSSMDKAEATKIVNNLRTIKSAALMRYTETGSWTNAKKDDYGTNLTDSGFTKWIVQKYAGITLSGNEANAYLIRGFNAATDSYISVRLNLVQLYPDDANKQSRMIKLLTAAAQNGTPIFGNWNGIVQYQGGVYVNMHIVKN